MGAPRAQQVIAAKLGRSAPFQPALRLPRVGAELLLRNCGGEL
jgi:hypothetical protein